MKRIFVLAIVALMPATSEAQVEAQPALAVFHFKDASCGAWARSAGSEPERAQYVYWFRGFVSGYNFGNPTNQVDLDRMPDLDTLALYVDKHCRDKPLEGFTVAAFDLVRELRDHPQGKTRAPGTRK